MTVFDLLTRPNSIFQRYPIRHWRQVTLWLKWGLLISLLSIIVRVVIADSNTRASWIFGLLEYLNSLSEGIKLDIYAQMPLFFITVSISILVTWMLKSFILLVGYQLMDGVFLEGRVALSISAATLVTNLWYVIPYVGMIAGTVHGCILMAILVLRINRLTMPGAMAMGILGGLIPVVY